MGTIIKQCLKTEQETRSLCGGIFDIRRSEEHERTDASVQRSMGRIDRRPPEAGSSGRSGQCSDSDKLLEAARRHEHGHEVRTCEVLQGRSDVPVRASSHHSGGRQVRRTRPSRERAATVGSSTQVRRSTTDKIVSRIAAVAGNPTRQVRSDEVMLRAVSVWLGEKGITPRSPKWLTLRFLLGPCLAVREV